MIKTNFDTLLFTDCYHSRLILATQMWISSSQKHKHVYKKLKQTSISDSPFKTFSSYIHGRWARKGKARGDIVARIYSRSKCDLEYIVICLAAVRYLNYLARGSRFWAKRKLSPVSVLHWEVN